jgi:hypothetical protein
MSTFSGPYRSGPCPSAVQNSRTWDREPYCAAPEDLGSRSFTLDDFPRRPLVSVLLPVLNPTERWLRRAIETVTQQSYPHWQLCVACDGSTNQRLRWLLEESGAQDARIVVRFLPRASDIAQVSNAALEMCRGELTAMLDPEDELTVDALLHLAWEAVHHPECDLLFSEKQVIAPQGNHQASLSHRRGQDPSGLSSPEGKHLSACQTLRLRQTGGFRTKVKQPMNWEIALNSAGGASSPSARARHIPQVLYRRRLCAWHQPS